MAGHVVGEECFKKAFENSTILKVLYFIVDSLYNQDGDSALSCEDMRNHCGFLPVDDETVFNPGNVKAVVNEINRMNPETLIFKKDPSYRGIAITKLGKRVLQNDISKIVPQEGIMTEDLFKLIGSSLVDTYKSNHWLCANIIDGGSIKYVRGEKYCDFVNLYNSLYQYNETNCLSNQEELVDAHLIEMIEGRYAIFRGPKFPLGIEDKFLVLYRSALFVYHPIEEEIIELEDVIRQNYKDMVRLQKAVQEHSGWNSNDY